MHVGLNGSSCSRAVGALYCDYGSNGSIRDLEVEDTIFLGGKQDQALSSLIFDLGWFAVTDNFKKGPFWDDGQAPSTGGLAMPYNMFVF